MIWYLLGGLIGVIFFKKRYNLSFWQAVWNGIIFAFGLYFGWGTILGITSLILGLEDYTEISIFNTIFYAALTLGSFFLIKQLKNKKTKAASAEGEKQKISYENNHDYKLGEIIRTSVVGVTFEGRQRLIHTLTRGQPIKLIREPENKHDSNAINIIVDDNKNIGYINKSLAKRIAPIIDDEMLDEIKGEIVSIYPAKNRPSVYGVKISFKLGDFQNESDNSIKMETTKIENELISTSPESYAKCPKCGRNDRIEKVKAIYENGTASPILISKLKPPNPDAIEMPNYLDIPEFSSPAKPLLKTVPEEFEPSSLTALAYMGCGLLFFFWLLLMLYSLGSGSSLISYHLIFGLLCGIAIYLAITQTKKDKQKFLVEKEKIRQNNARNNSDWKIIFEEKEQDYHELVEKIKKDNSFLKEKYYKDKLIAKNKYTIWENLYYCYRDDTIFIPDTGHFAQVEKLDEYLTKSIKDYSKN